MRAIKKYLLSILTLTGFAFANDGFGALGAGGIIIGKTNDIAMAKEVLDISYDKIKVDYEFVNESDKDITETIVFPLPSYLVGNPNPYYFGTIPDFEVIVDGKPVRFETKVRAMSFEKNSKDITNKLRKIGFSDYEIVMLEYDNEMLKSKSHTLVKNGMIDKEDNVMNYPLWTNYVTYEWKQTFKAGQKLKVSHSYTPLPGGGVGVCYFNDRNEYDLISSRKDIGKRYCVDSKTLDRLDTLAKDKNNYKDYSYSCLKAFSIEYILKTANTWKDGIRDFHLIIRTRTPDEIISTCFSKPLIQTSKTTYEVKLKNFKPAKDLRIYFGNVDKNAPFQPEAKPPIFFKDAR